MGENPDMHKMRFNKHGNSHIGSLGHNLDIAAFAKETELMH